MGTDPIYERLRELSWRRKLSATEESELREWLAKHAEAQESLDLEAGLTEALGKMRDVPVASNFTARVLQAVERETTAEARGERGRGNLWRRLPRWLPRMVSAAVVLIAGVFAYQHSVEAKHKASAQMVAEIRLPDPQILMNFDAIRVVSQTPAPDEQLLALFK
jgi:negative regulator of sigma E activity